MGELEKVDCVKAFYKNRIQLELDLKSYKSLLSAEQKRLQILIDSQGPKDVKAVCYDESDCKISAPYLAALEVYTQIQEAQEKICKYSSMVTAFETELNLLDIELEKAANKLGDAELKIFVYTRAKHLNLRETARLMNYSYDRVRHLAIVLSAKLKNYDVRKVV